jgi:hypothetical protein
MKASVSEGLDTLRPECRRSSSRHARVRKHEVTVILCRGLVLYFWWARCPLSFVTAAHGTFEADPSTYRGAQ